MTDPDAFATIDEIAAAESPEEAARIGRARQRSHPHLLRPDWDTAKLFVMQVALQAKVRLITHVSLWSSSARASAIVPVNATFLLQGVHQFASLHDESDERAVPGGCGCRHIIYSCRLSEVSAVSRFCKNSMFCRSNQSRL